MNNKLAVVLITLNEGRDLARCLKSVKELASEIIVVDSGSTDETIQIAKRFGAKVYFRKFDNYSNQKNFAVSQAKSEWILSLDADEEISPELVKEIREAIQSDEFDAYTIPRENIIFGKVIKHTRWQSELDRHIWLWKRGKGRWVGDVHEEVVVEGKVGRLKNPKIHYQYETIKEFLDMMNRYSELEANQRLKDGVVFSYLQLFIQPLYNFMVRYFYRLGFLDGWRGFVLSYLMAMYHLELWVKIWEKTKARS